MALQKEWKFKKKGNADLITKLSKELNNINPILSNLLVQRGITNFEDARNFFRPDIKKLHDPFLMKDMDIATERIKQAINNDEKILIYGDYDVDGTSAVALVYSFISRLSPNIDFYIPDRDKEGYGISIVGIDYAHQHNFKLIITLDCGTKAIDKIKYGNEKNIDFIICDHHNEGDSLPDAIAILNPKRTDCQYPYKELSGCGVGFKLVQALAEKYKIPFDDIKPLLDLVVLSIAADIVPITGENRIMAYYGLKRINTNPRPGIEACLKTAGIKRRPESLEKVEYNFSKYITISELVFTIAPRVNAAGRIKQAKDSVDLLLSQTLDESLELAEKIDEFNTERKNLNKSAFEEAVKRVQSDPNFHNKKTIVLFDKNWHKGIIGIVASQLVEFFYKPTMVFTESNGLYTGSARSIKDFDLYQAVESCSHLLEHFGGHKYAAGMSLKSDNFQTLCKHFEEVASKTLTEDMMIPEIEIDDTIEFSDITPKFIKTLKQFAPFGPGNMSPIFHTKNTYDTGHSRPIGNNHLKLNITQAEFRGMGFDAIAFNFAHLFSKFHDERKPAQICYHIDENEWNGVISTQLTIKDMYIDEEIEEH